MLVLVVEDDQTLLNLCIKLLENLGYRVLAANSPGEALLLAEKHFSEINLLVTDVVMPIMNGQELADRLQSIIPNLGVIYMSGYATKVMTDYRQGRRKRKLLAKTIFTN